MQRLDTPCLSGQQQPACPSLAQAAASNIVAVAADTCRTMTVKNQDLPNHLPKQHKALSFDRDVAVQELLQRLAVKVSLWEELLVLLQLSSRFKVRDEQRDFSQP